MSTHEFAAGTVDEARCEMVDEMPLVLVADDAAPMRDLLRMVLEDMGYDVAEAADGASALAFLRDTDRRVIALLDYRMPDMTGLDVLEAVSRDAELSFRHAYILMTAHPRTLPEQTRFVLPALGATFVRKPFDLDQLLQVIAERARRLGLRYCEYLCV